MIHQLHRAALGLFAAGCLACFASPAWAVDIGTTNTFEGAGAIGWSSGFNHPSPPTRVASGGPGGVGDAFLLLTALGSGAGGKLVSFSGAEWGGDYLAAQITGIRMDVRLISGTLLNLRLAVDGGPGSAVSASPVTLTGAGSGWMSVLFPLRPADLAGGAVGDVLAHASRLRLIGTSAVGTAPVDVLAQLGVDNITAVPEPASAWTLMLGLAALAVGLRARHGRRRHTPGAAAGIFH